MKETFIDYVRTGMTGRGFLLIACGLPGTLKTETTAEVARITGYPLLRTDLIRLEVLQNEDVFAKHVASSMEKRLLIYEETFRRADESLESSEGVILDATFITQELRRNAAAIAAKNELWFVILQTDCPEETSLARILKRTKENYESNALTEQAYLNNKKNFEKVDVAELKSLYPNICITHLTIDTTSEKPEDWSITALETR